MKGATGDEGACVVCEHEERVLLQTIGQKSTYIRFEEGNISSCSHNRSLVAVHMKKQQQVDDEILKEVY